MVRQLRLDLLIEDELHVALAVAVVPIPVLLFDRPWNRGKLPTGITRVRDWSQVLHLVASQASSRSG
jgi:uncharacterized HAD superfamily protein